MEQRTVVAIDIGGTKIASALVTLGGDRPQVVSARSVPTDAARGGEAVLRTVIDQVRDVIARTGAAPCGVGISSAGTVDVETGDITYANDLMPGLRHQRGRREANVSHSYYADFHYLLL